MHYNSESPGNNYDRGANVKDRSKYRDEVYSKRVSAGRRTYFFDVKPTNSGEDFFIVVTESKRVEEYRYEKHKIFLYKEDFSKFLCGLQDVMQHIKDECLPGYEFGDLPGIEGCLMCDESAD